MTLLNALKNGTATVEGNTMVVRFPVWQFLSIGALGISVIFSVWLTTRDLGSSVDANTAAMRELANRFEGLDDEVEQVRLQNARFGQWMEYNHAPPKRD